MRLKIFMLIACGFMAGCENWPNGYLITKYYLKSCIKFDSLLIEKLENSKYTFELDPSGIKNACIVTYKTEGGALFGKYLVRVPVHLSSSGCEIETVVYVNRQGCDKKFENYNQKDCDDSKLKSEKFRDDFIEVLTSKLKQEIDSKKTEAKLIEGVKNYKFDCETVGKN